MASMSGGVASVAFRRVGVVDRELMLSLAMVFFNGGSGMPHLLGTICDKACEEDTRTISMAGGTVPSVTRGTKTRTASESDSMCKMADVCTSKGAEANTDTPKDGCCEALSNAAVVVVGTGGVVVARIEGDNVGALSARNDDKCAASAGEDEDERNEEGRGGGGDW
jgi:hypothetical protein